MSDFINNRRARRALQAGAIVASIGAGYALRDLKVDAQDGATTSAPPTQKAPVVSTAAVRDAASMQGAFADVATAVEPAVVTITTAGTRTPAAAQGGRQRMRPYGQGQSAPNGADPFGGDLQQFFKQFQKNFGFDQQSFNSDSWQGRVLRQKWAEAKAQMVQDEGNSNGGERSGGGLGSGMIYRSDGLILTNAHVVQDATTVSVTLSDGRTFDKAKVLGRDTRTDIAVVKIDATNLPTVKLGDSNGTRVGDWAIAVGNPFGLDHTLTVGVISAKSRQLDLAKDTRTDYLQTDASINPGNSGGPLLDIYGRVIGINNAIYSESGGNQGIGFAIPINVARDVSDMLVKEGRVRRAYLGVEIQDLRNGGAAFGLPTDLKGVLIARIADPNSPGAKAGLQPGDVVTKFNDKPVASPGELQGLVGSAPIGSTATLSVVRGGKPITLSAKLEELKDASPAKNAPAPDAQVDPTKGQPSAIPGLKIKTLSPEVAQAMGIKASHGIVVTDVDNDSPADNAGLLRGDVIERVAQTPVTGAADFGTAVTKILGQQTGDAKKVALYVNRNGESNFVIVTID